MITVLSLVSTPDVPLLFFWTASLLALYHAIFLGKNTYWLWSGLLIGLSFDSKYTAILLPAGIIIFLLLSNQHRKKLLSPWPWLSFLLSVVIALPVIIWNIQNQFVSFKFQSLGRINEMNKGLHLNILGFLGVIGHQSFVLLPVLCFSLIIFLYKIIKKYKFRLLLIYPKQLFLLCFFIPTFAGFFFISFFTWVKLNWQMPAYITGIIWVSRYFKASWIRIQIIISCIIHILMAIEILFYPILVRSDDVWIGWSDLAQKVTSLRTQYPADFVFAADDYKTSSELNFYLSGELIYSGNVIGQPGLEYEFIGTNLKKLKGRNALFIDSDPLFKNELKKNISPSAVRPYFDSVIELEPIIIKKGYRTVRKFLIYECKNYHPLKLNTY